MQVLRLLIVIATLAFGCDGDDKSGSGLECGEGTHEEDGSCVPDENADTDTDTDTDIDDTGESSSPDHDGDGFTVEDGDCDDESVSINPYATDIVGDGIDQNCDGIDGTDMDGDGHASEASGGTDCDDEDASVTSFTEDADCDGVLTVDDCDDDDVSSTTISEDPDCDGTVETFVERIEVACSAAAWDYQVSMLEDLGEGAYLSASLIVMNDHAEEFHTLQMGGPFSFELSLLLVEDYYYQDIATQFACTEGHPDLTWRLDIFADADSASHLHCVTWGHDTSEHLDDGCRGVGPPVVETHGP